MTPDEQQQERQPTIRRYIRTTAKIKRLQEKISTTHFHTSRSSSSLSSKCVWNEKKKTQKKLRLDRYITHHHHHQLGVIEDGDIEFISFAHWKTHTLHYITLLYEQYGLMQRHATSVCVCVFVYANVFN